ncbi:NGG1p interacting factor NIF3 [bacterium]|nr:NGG1p interacting factor NIF3 [bacterium]
MLKLQELYDSAIAAGISADRRPKKEIDRLLEAQQRDYKKLEGAERERFDAERLSNPFADSRILYGDPETEVKGALVGIDIGPAELLLVDRLRGKGQRIDLVISHHPSGRALANLADVIPLQADLWAQAGVPIAQAEGAYRGRVKEVSNGVSAINHNRTVDIARLLDIPLMCIHTPADNCAVKYLDDLIKEKSPYLLGDVMDLLLEVEEYKQYANEVSAPKIAVGSKGLRTGEVFVDMTGGTSGPKDFYELVARSTSVSTLLCMHIPEEHRKEIEKHHLNCIVAPHMPSDTLGVNRVLDACEAMGEVSFIECSGFRRFRRNK